VSVSGLPNPMVPDFLILGAQKCGTTSLAQALAAHPDVFIPDAKEAHHYGSVDDDSVGGDTYRRFFRDWNGERLVGEATPNYLYDPESQRQISANVPDLRAIVVLRNPVDRAYSAYWHAVRSGDASGSFEEAMDADNSPLSRGDMSAPLLVDRGRYALQIERYLAGGLDHSRLHVIVFEELVADPVVELERVQRFLGIEPIPMVLPTANVSQLSRLPRPIGRLLERVARRSQTARTISNKLLYEFEPPAMNPETRSELLDRFSPDNEALSELLGRDLPMWRH
jgi:hypothetical protein